MSALRVAVAVVLAVLAGLCLFLGSLALEQSEQIGTRDRTIEQQAQLIAGQSRLVSDYKGLQRVVTEVATATRAMQADLALQAHARRAADLELMNNDPTVRAWAAMPVPAAIGVRYERPATTDPRQWRNPGRVRAGVLPTPGAVGAD